MYSDASERYKVSTIEWSNSSWKTFIKADWNLLKLLLLPSLLLLLGENARNGLLPEPEPVLEVVRHHGHLGVDPEHVGGCGRHRRPGRGDVLRHAGRRDAGLGEVGQQRSEDVPRNRFIIILLIVIIIIIIIIILIIFIIIIIIIIIIIVMYVLPGELGVGGGHLELLPPDAVEDVLEVVAMRHAHVDLLALEVDDAVLAAVLEAVLVGRDGVVGEDPGEPVRAPRVHQVCEELDISGSELLLVLHVDVGEVLLADLSGERVELGAEVRDDGEDAGQLVVHEVVVVLTVVERVQCQTIEESSLVLGLAHDEGNLGKVALHESILGRVGQDGAVDAGSEPAGE